MIEISLRDLQARISLPYGDDRPAILFLCPICEHHHHLIPFNPGSKKSKKEPERGNVWANPNGSTIDDITLSPSYVTECPPLPWGTCYLHVFIRNGVMQVLGDSSPIGSLKGEEE